MRRELHGLNNSDQLRERLVKLMNRANRRRPRGSAPAMATLPFGPLPLAGGAEASLDLD
jgi:hypothetical protein